jgi:xylan 1,4-beta-xylosidase
MLEYSNPVLSGMFPDPSVCRVGEYFYLVNSTFEYFPGLPLHRSRNLVDWEPIGSVLDRPEQLDLSNASDSGGLFAPAIRHHEGTFYVVCTLMGKGSFVVSTTDPSGPWGNPVHFPEAEGIDPSISFHDRKAWWVGCRKITPGDWEGHTEIWLREVDLDRGIFVGDEHILWSGALRNAWWTEGPHIYEHGGFYYLVTAEGGTEFNHSVTVARSTELKGPYAGNPRNPILTHRQLGHGAVIQNVGHADLVEAQDGSWWALVLGTRPIDGHHLLGRETFLTPVTWEDDWPVINAGVGMLSQVVNAGAAHVDHDGERDGNSTSWLTLRGPDEFVQVQSAGLVLSPLTENVTHGHPAFLGRRLQHHDVEVTLELTVGAGATGGLFLRQSDANQVRLEVTFGATGWLARSVVRLAGAEITVETTELASDAVPDAAMAAEVERARNPQRGAVEVTLGAVFRGLELRLWVKARGERTELGTVDARLLSSDTAGGFVGTIVGPFVVASDASATLREADDSPRMLVRSLDYQPLDRA